MSALAHPVGSIAPLTPTRRRHLWLVPESGERETLADVIRFPVRPARPVAQAPARTAPQAAQAPLRLTVRGRRVLVALVLAAAAAAGSIAGAVASAGAASPTEVEQVTVASGDTLWSVAAAVADPGQDVREVMSQIAELNDLQGPSLAAGQVLTVPEAG